MWVPDGGDAADGRCLIHTTATERYVDPVRTLIARLVDELLRTFGLAEEVLSAHVPRLQPIQQGAIEHEDGSLLFSLPGRGDDELFQQLGYIGRKPTEYTRGLVFPEETSLPGRFDEGNIPGDMAGSWAAVFRHLLLGEDISRSPYLKFQIVFTQLSGMTAYEKSVGHPITGSESDWKELAEMKNLQIVMTNVDPSLQLLQPYKRLGNTESTKFVVLDGNGMPFQAKSGGAIVFSLTDLPSPIRSWLATQGVGTVAEAPQRPAAKTAAAPAPEYVLRKPAAAPVEKAKKTRGKTTYPAGRTATNGDCFFSAIFRAAKERGKPVLDAIAKCLGLTITSEPKFILAFRNKIATHIASGHLPSGEGREGRLNTYDVFVEMVTDPGQYKARIQSYPEWFGKTFGPNGESIGTREEFATSLAEQVRTSGNWVSEIEVTIAKEMLDACNVILRIENSNKIKDIRDELQTEADGGKTVLNLWNQGESHYVYFIMTPEDAAGGAGAAADAEDN
jgi:hypothetical protein